MNHGKPWRALASIAAAFLVACGGGGFEIFVKLITAQFEPPTVAMAAGTTQRVNLEVTCDKNGLTDDFGVLSIEVRLDPDRQLPAGVTASVVGGNARTEPDAIGLFGFACDRPTSDPNLSSATIPVDIKVTSGAVGGPATLVAFVQIAPRLRGITPSKDQTLAELTIDVTAGTGNSNLLFNPNFTDPTQAGTIPAGPGYWRGDLHSLVAQEGDIAPRSAPTMLKFIATGDVASTNTLASQVWQLVDVSAWATAIDTGRASVDGSVWFNRVIQSANTDRRFDLRLLAFGGLASEVAGKYGAGQWLGQATTSLDSAGLQWQQATAALVLPEGTRFLLFEIYAFEDVLNDTGSTPEFDGHYADDAALTITIQP